MKGTVINMKFHPFLYNKNIRFTENTQLCVCNPKKEDKIYLEEGLTANPSVEWEQRIDNGYANVFYDTEYEEYRLYYTVFVRDDSHKQTSLEERRNSTYKETGSRQAAILMARSKDGELWERPSLGVCNFGGSFDNNILIRGVHGAGVFRDEQEKNADRRYKMIVRNDIGNCMAQCFSRDGIHWTEPINWTKYNPAGDTHNYAWYDERLSRYILMTRTWSDNQRILARCESDDFINWSEPVEAFRGNGIDDQIYSMPVFENDGIYYGLGSFFHGGSRTAEDFDCVDLELLCSGDSKNWNRVSEKSPFIKRGSGKYPDGERDCGCIYCSTPIEVGDKYRFYYFGGNGQHTNFRETCLMSATIHKDELACFSEKQGKRARIITPMLEFNDEKLYLRAKINDSSRISVGISDFFTIHREPEYFDGFSPSDSVLKPLSDNLYEVSFPKEIFELTRKVCLVFEFENAELFGFYTDIK